MKDKIETEIAERIKNCNKNMYYLECKDDFYLDYMYNLLNGKKFLNKYYKYQDAIIEEMCQELKFKELS